jgi:hypothetical protein
MSTSKKGRGSAQSGKFVVKKTVKIMPKKSGSKRGTLGGVQNITKMNTGIGPVKGVSASYSRKITTVAPRIIKSGKSFRVQHRELVNSSVSGSATFAIQNSLALNPGLAATFPWLAPQAGQWEQYVVHKLSAIYTPLAPTSTAGTVTISPDYDASDPTPTSEIQLSDNYDTVEDSVWQDIVCLLDVGAMMASGPRKFVRPCQVAGDIKTFDIGKLFVATNNGSSAAVGKLWLDYDFEFFVPQNSPSPSTFPQQTSFFTLNGNQTFTSNTPTPLDWDTTVFDPLNIGPPNAGVFTPPAGVYRIEAQVTGRDSASEAFEIVTYLYKNGATLSKVVGSNVNFDGALGTYVTGSVSLLGVLALNGSDTFNIEVELIGSAGTLIAFGEFCQLLVSLA